MHLRGSGGSQKGRPTNSTFTSSKTLSSNTRAVQQRQRDATQSTKEQALKKARDADRQAVKQLKNKLGKDESHVKLSERDQAAAFERAKEAMVERRFREKKSGTLSQTLITF